MALYQGYPDRTPRGGLIVTKDGKALSPEKSQKVINHSPDGFNWGYGGSGSTQLALALLLEETSQEEAERMYQDFKWQIVAKLPQDKRWGMNSEQIQNWLNEHRGIKA